MNYTRKILKNVEHYTKKGDKTIEIVTEKRLAEVTANGKCLTVLNVNFIRI